MGHPTAVARATNWRAPTILRSLLSLVREDGVSHVGIAFDHVIESFRNELFKGYKTGEGIPEDLMSQFPMAERASHALGVVTWAMVDFEADDALATGAARWAQAPDVEQVLICTPDKDLAQYVTERRVVRLDRMRRLLLDEAGVIARFGVPPRSIPDWLALVGDSADGIPGIPRWGEKGHHVARTLRPDRRHPGRSKALGRQRAR